MSQIEYIHQLAGIDSSQLEKDEILLLEAAMLDSLCNELSMRYQGTFNHIKEYHQEISTMINAHFIYFITHDLINSNDYTIEGIANYSDIPEEVIVDIIIGTNNNPSIEVSRKIIELHRLARPDLYKRILNKITSHLFTTHSLAA
jgi:hypothetical protein